MKWCYVTCSHGFTVHRQRVWSQAKYDLGKKIWWKCKNNLFHQTEEVDKALVQRIPFGAAGITLHIRNECLFKHRWSAYDYKRQGIRWLIKLERGLYLFIVPSNLNESNRSFIFFRDCVISSGSLKTIYGTYNRSFKEMSSSRKHYKPMKGFWHLIPAILPWKGKPQTLLVPVFHKFCFQYHSL